MSTSIPHHPRKSTRRRPDPPATNENAASEPIVPPNSDVGSNFPFDMDDGDDDDDDDDDEFDITNQPWRQYGLRRRQYLLENDKAATSYRMNAACSIQKYFSLSERVIAQFQELYEKNAIEDAYVMGNRLIAFLGTALPRHPAYATSVAQRTVAQHHLQDIKVTMKRISILIDEEQLNRYITNDFDPLIDDDDDDDDSNNLLQNEMDNFETSASTSWEAFGGWTCQTDTTPGFVDTDESSQDIDSDIDFADFDLTKRWGASGGGDHKSNAHDLGITDSPISDRYDDDDTEDSDDGRTDPFAMRMKPPVLAQSILRKIAREAVRYESDSEAADSWAQDGNCGASDATSSSEMGDAATTTSSSLYHSNSPRAAAAAPIISCDPARMAFRSIMNRHTRHLQSLQVEMESLLSPDPLPYQPQPKKLPMSKFDLPHNQYESSTTEEEKKEEELNQDDQNDDPKETKPPQENDNVKVSLSFFPLPPPAISAPQSMGLMLKEMRNTTSNCSISDAPTVPFLVPRDESPFRPDASLATDTPFNSPEEANLHRATVPSTVVSHRWGVQLRRMSPQASPSPSLRPQHLL